MKILRARDALSYGGRLALSSRQRTSNAVRRRWANTDRHRLADQMIVVGRLIDGIAESRQSQGLDRIALFM
jgi:hypothetical protein